MRLPGIILLLVLMAGCATAPPPSTPNAYKYESNAAALDVYVKEYGEGYQRGCSMATTAYGWQDDEVYKSYNSLLQAAALDGFDDGDHAAMQLVQQEMRQLKKHVQKAK